MPEDPKPLDEIIGEGADAGPGAEPQTQPETADRGDRSWTYSALKDERGKRQALAERNAELEAQLQSHAQQQQVQDNDVWADPEGYISRQIQTATLPTTLRASRAEFVADHGRAALNAIEEAVGAAMHRGDPDMLILSEHMRRSDDPVALAAAWYESTHGPRQRPSRAPAYPSNLSTARNVGARRQGWTGPPSLDDIFNRVRVPRWEKL